MTEIKTKTGKDEGARVVTVQYDIPESTKAFVEKYGEEQTVALATRSLTLAIQALVRQKAAAGETDEQCQQAVNSFVPGVRGPRATKSPLERAQATLSALSPEDLKVLMDKVRAAQKHAH